MMRWQAVIVFLAIVVGAIAPPSFNMTGAHGGQAAIGTLDICHAGTPALSPKGDMPCMNECPSLPLLLSQKRALVLPAPRCKPLLFAYQDERPPKA